MPVLNHFLINLCWISKCSRECLSN